MNCVFGCCRRKVVLLSLCLIAFASQLSLGQGRIAMVIGNSNYKRLYRLPTSAEDARQFAKTISQPKYGFSIYGNGPLLDRSKVQMETAVMDFIEQSKNKDCALFFFSGHGVQTTTSYNQDDHSTATNFLLPVDDAKLEDALLNQQALPLWLLTTQLKAKVNIVILDCCRNNNLYASNSSNTFPLKGGPEREGLAEQRTRRGTLVFFSAQPGSTACAEGHGSLSLFTGCLLENLSRGDWWSVFTYTRDQVERESLELHQKNAANHEQSPEVIPNLSHEGFNFLLPRGRVEIAPLEVGPPIAPPPKVRQALYCEGLPSSLEDNLRQLLKEGDRILSAQFWQPNDSFKYVVTTEDQLVSSKGISNALLAACKRKPFRKVFLGANDDYLVAYEDDTFDFHFSLPQLKEDLDEGHANNWSLSYAALRGDGYVLVFNSKTDEAKSILKSYNPLDYFAEALERAQSTGSPVKCIGYGPDSSYFILTGRNGFKSSRNTPSAFRAKLNELNEAGANIRCAELLPNGGWLIASDIQ